MRTQPQTIAKAAWKQSRIELFILFVLTSVAATSYLDMHWLWATLAAPFLMLVVLGGVAAMVQSLWVLVTSLERIGTACGLRKSPLA